MTFFFLVSHPIFFENPRESAKNKQTTENETQFFKEEIQMCDGGIVDIMDETKQYRF